MKKNTVSLVSSALIFSNFSASLIQDARAGDVLSEYKGQRLHAECVSREVDGFCSKMDLIHTSEGKLVLQKTIQLMRLSGTDEKFVYDEEKSQMGGFNDFMPFTKIIGREALAAGGYTAFMGLTVVNLFAYVAMEPVLVSAVVIGGVAIATLPPTVDVLSFPVRKLIAALKKGRAQKTEAKAGEALQVLLSEEYKDIQLTKKEFKSVANVIFNYTNDGQKASCAIQREVIDNYGNQNDRELPGKYRINVSDSRGNLQITKRSESFERILKKLSSLKSQGVCNPIVAKCTQTVASNGFVQISMINRSPFFSSDSPSESAKMKERLVAQGVCTF